MEHDQTVQETLPAENVRPASVVIVPSDRLVFAQCQEGRAKAHLVIYNPTDEDLIYKFRTNAGKTDLAVRPCSGHIHSGDHADIDCDLSYASSDAVANLKLIVVIANAPKTPKEFNLKTVWQSIDSSQQRTTTIMCLVNPKAAHQRESCFFHQIPAPSGPVDSSHLLQPLGQSHCHQQSRQQPSSVRAPVPPSPPPKPQMPMVAQEPPSPPPKTQMPVVAQEQHQQYTYEPPAMSVSHQQEMSRLQAPMAQPLVAFRTFEEPRKHTSFFIDASPIAEREMQSAMSNVLLGGMDKNSLIQMGLVGVGLLAAMKLFTE